MEQRQFPLILSLKINDEAFIYFDGLRKKHFPPERNFIEAHLTLFHHLPQMEEIVEDIKEVVQHQPIISLSVQQVVSIGNGVAFKIESKKLQEIHRGLQKRWWTHLTPQDKQGLWPHITVQNKVPAIEAKKLQSELAQDFKAFEIAGLGFDLWEYHGGPWKHVQAFLFAV